MIQMSPLVGRLVFNQIINRPSNGQSSYVQVRVEAPVSAKGGSSERVTITITSSGNENIFENVI